MCVESRSDALHSKTLHLRTIKKRLMGAVLMYPVLPFFHISTPGTISIAVFILLFKFAGELCGLIKLCPDASMPLVSHP